MQIQAPKVGATIRRDSPQEPETARGSRGERTKVQEVQLALDGFGIYPCASEQPSGFPQDWPDAEDEDQPIRRQDHQRTFRR